MKLIEWLENDYCHGWLKLIEWPEYNYCHGWN